jgi:hypothetical protein
MSGIELLDGNILKELIIKKHLNLKELLNIRMTNKMLYKETDINNKENNKYLWKFYYVKDEINNYTILVNSEKCCINEKDCYSEWYKKIYIPCYEKGKSTFDEVFNEKFKKKNYYLKNLFRDCWVKKRKISLYNELYEFWKELGEPCVFLDHYDLSTCNFNCDLNSNKYRNYKCFFKEIAKKQKMKYKKFLSIKDNNIKYIENKIDNCEDEFENSLKHYKKKLETVKDIIKKYELLKNI